MAKVKPFLPGVGQTPRSKGDFIVLATPHGYVAQKWPKKRGPASTPYDLWRHKEFAWVANAVSSPYALDYGTAVEMVKGTTYVPRDFLMMCAYANAYDLYAPDGTKYQRYRDVTNNPQYMLEQLTDTPGAIIYRDTDLWTWLGPANNGYVLTMEDQRPVWKAPPSVVGSGFKTTVLRRTSDQVNLSAASHKVTWQEAVIDELNIWDPATPTRLIMPSNINRFRLSFQILSPVRSFNLRYNIRSLDQSGLATFFGAFQQYAYQTDTSSTTSFNISGQGPWAPDASVSYIEMQLVPSTASPWTFATNTSLTIECVQDV
jgi:hypothetical protein